MTELIKESTNFRRFVTGNIAGIGLMGLYFTNILKKDLKN
ncbi:DUF2085 domain-containing protein [Clostridium estertheticum]|uniref:DUF2085 domain-containing protein n=1 Tax=Clostridium estertheticum TaxID=238834 RepID=A0AA47EQ03_9CLOT|nr:DUF2085 domain-containing protein [Clostridium estertheticum]MBZ9613977.1 DUF2085 domain-containing protein [Clostridium estertheticum subsp. laramiense]MBU3156906.1 DUF2085 domain-containing protein [Clostridium estertheticum]MBU3162644.1 DUF2085 domain-containing protein [Clostridium estertheticum]MBX4262602.1 DUF2085 domain-containing protein [Clostridium estertheticum]